MNELDQKLTATFDGKVLRKDLLHRIKKGTNVPTFVLEFLLARFCASDDQAEMDSGMEAVLASLQDNYVKPDEANAAQSKVAALVEPNYNYIELGPRGTGKSYFFSEFSPYATLISGGQATKSALFYNNARRKVGLVGFWDTVAFDEVGGIKVKDPDTIQIMKDFMANGRARCCCTYRNAPGRCKASEERSAACESVYPYRAGIGWPQIGVFQYCD